MGSQVPTLQKLTSAQKNTLARDVWQAPPRPGRQPRPRLRGGGPLCGEEADYSQFRGNVRGCQRAHHQGRDCLHTRHRSCCCRLAINTINSSLRGLERYQTAIQAGINGEDCALIYDQCRVSYVGYREWTTTTTTTTTTKSGLSLSKQT